MYPSSHRSKETSEVYDMVFEELRLKFGDTYAPMFFNRLHQVIITAFVTVPNSIPRSM